MSLQEQGVVGRRSDRAMIAAAAVSPSCAFVVIKARALAHGAAGDSAELQTELAPCSTQAFMNAYAAAHRVKFGEDFSIVTSPSR